MYKTSLYHLLGQITIISIVLLINSFVFVKSSQPSSLGTDEEIALVLLVEDSNFIDVETFINESETEKFNPLFCVCFNQFLLLDIFDSFSTELFCFNSWTQHLILPGMNGDLPPPVENS